ncbi:MAG: citrate lyase subunit alpha, partial [Cetobacterium sp.]
MKNILGRDIPEFIDGYGEVKQYEGYLSKKDGLVKKDFKFKTITREDSKLYRDLNELMDRLPLRDGMVVSFHHHLRNGDFVLNMVMEEIAKRGYKDITIAASSIF